ncbi:MAG: hypothetical protein ABR559_08020, partial [Gemmatimonadota bacterium]
MPARFPVLLVLALAGCAPRYRPPADTLTSPDAFNYYVRVATTRADRFEVTLAAERVNRDSLDFIFPAWIPGRYHPGPGRARPENFTARDGRGRPIAVRRLSGSAWRLYPPDGADYVAVTYHIIPEASDEPLAFRPQLGIHGGFAPGGALFGYLLGFEERPVTVSFDLPAGWRVAAPLRPGGANRFAAASYATLPGTPIVVGDRMRDYKLFVQGRPHQITVSGADAGFAPDSLLRLISETIDHGARFYGRPTYERYLFAVHFVPPDADGIGAMGQTAGSAFFLPVLSGDRLREGGIGGLLLHQYLHAWYPGSFGPVALRRPDFFAPPVLQDEWLIEGAAEYYARLLPVRTGGVGRHAFYETMGELLTLWR